MNEKIYGGGCSPSRERIISNSGKSLEGVRSEKIIKELNEIRRMKIKKKVLLKINERKRKIEKERKKTEKENCT